MENGKAVPKKEKMVPVNIAKWVLGVCVSFMCVSLFLIHGKWIKSNTHTHKRERYIKIVHKNIKIPKKDINMGATISKKEISMSATGRLPDSKKDINMGTTGCPPDSKNTHRCLPDSKYGKDH